MEFLLGKDRLQEARALHPVFENALKQVLQSLEKLKTSFSPDTDLYADEYSGDYSLLFDELAGLLEDGDTDAAEKAEALMKCPDTHRFQEKIAGLVKQVNRYDFEDALETLAEIRAAYNGTPEGSQDEG